MARLGSVREFLFDELDDPAALMCSEANFSAAAVARSRGRKAFANASACRGLGAVFIILRTNSSFRRCTEVEGLDVRDWDYIVLLRMPSDAEVSNALTCS